MKDLTKLNDDCLFQGRLRKFAKTYFVKETKKIAEKHQISIISGQDFPKTNDFINVWTNLKELYYTKQNNRCAICEKEINDIYSADIEHYRPKSYYWWLAYNPTNYYLSCAECNRSYKKERFPCRSQVAYTERKEIGNEVPLLFNPTLENFNLHVRLIFIIHPTTNKGIAILQSNSENTLIKEKTETTINVYNLDLHSYKTKTDKSRFDLLHKYYNDLFEIAKARLELDKIYFYEFLKNKIKNERPELKSLDLLKLITSKQFEINTIMN